jgi:hypothetical protein
MSVNMERGFEMTKGEQICIIILQLVAIFMFIRIISATAGCAEVDYPVGWQDIVVDAAVPGVALIDAEESNTSMGEEVIVKASEFEQNDAQDPVALRDMGIDLPGGMQGLYDCETIDILTCCTTRDELGQPYRTCTWKIDGRQVPAIPPIIIEPDCSDDIPGC